MVDDVGAPWSPDVPSLAYSCSKTFTSAAVGIAVNRGAFGYDDTLADLWPQACTANTGPVAKSMTVRNALSMSTGHSPEQLLEPTLVSRRLPDLNTARILLATEPEGRPGIDFAYNNLATWMLSRLVAQHTGEDVDTIITKEVLDRSGRGHTPGSVTPTASRWGSQDCILTPKTSLCSASFSSTMGCMRAPVYYPRSGSGSTVSVKSIATARPIRNGEWGMAGRHGCQAMGTV
ncbi:6-aminohexanoate-dimer hydrolase [Cutibacterium acnes JCM 18920]|nr:6-aminohexanoate-dimer hydrolase [Cutibacterium acnes JCM 18920]